MKRTAQEMTEKFREVVASQSEDEIANFLEDINDSVGKEVDMSGYVAKEEYDKAVTERDAAVATATDYRDRYINRFYNPGNNSNDITIVQGGAKQLEIEQTEKEFGYSDLFE